MYSSLLVRKACGQEQNKLLYELSADSTESSRRILCGIQMGISDYLFDKIVKQCTSLYTESVYAEMALRICYSNVYHFLEIVSRFIAYSRIIFHRAHAIKAEMLYCTVVTDTLKWLHFIRCYLLQGIHGWDFECPNLALLVSFA